MAKGGLGDETYLPDCAGPGPPGVEHARGAPAEAPARLPRRAPLPQPCLCRDACAARCGASAGGGARFRRARTVPKRWCLPAAGADAWGCRRSGARPAAVPDHGDGARGGGDGHVRVRAPGAGGLRCRRAAGAPPPLPRLLRSGTAAKRARFAIEPRRRAA